MGVMVVRLLCVKRKMMVSNCSNEEGVAWWKVRIEKIKDIGC